MPSKRGLLERLNAGEHVLCAEGYLFEFERRGYLKAGAFVPEVVVEHPDLVRAMHEEFVHAGSDVVEAFTYYGHRAKLRLIGREDELETFNTTALNIARAVANETGTLMAGNISNSTVFIPGDEKAIAEARTIFKEQIEWAVEAGADYIIGETYGEYGEAELALQCILEYGKGLPAVITMTPADGGRSYDTGESLAVCLKRLEDKGAAVVGINCFRGPDTIAPLVKEIRKQCKGPIACLPVPYRTYPDAPCMQDLRDQRTGERSFPGDLDSWLISRSHMVEFTQQMKELGVQYMGICCGNRAHYTRAMAEALGRTPPASKYSPDMSQHLSQVESESNTFAKQGWHKSFNKQAQA